MEILKEFGIEPILLAAQIVNFAILLLLLKKLFYQPILKLLDERKEKIIRSQQLAEEIEKKMAQVDLEKAQILASAKQEAEKIIREAKTQAQALADQIQQQAEAAAKAALLKNQKLLAAEKEAMLKEVRNYLTELVIATSEKVLADSLSETEKRKITQAIIKEIRN